MVLSGWGLEAPEPEAITVLCHQLKNPQGEGNQQIFFRVFQHFLSAGFSSRFPSGHIHEDDRLQHIFASVLLLISRRWISLELGVSCQWIFPPGWSAVVRLCLQQCRWQLLCVCQCDLSITRQKSIPSPFLPSPPRAPQQQC